MSKANAKAFLRELMASKELVERCLAVSEEERLRIAAAMGFPHTGQDMQAVIDEGVIKARQHLRELTEQELEGLSAGQGATEVIIVPVVVMRVLSPNMTLRDPLRLDLN
jgi:predicted ribosomally synthesized peptide with nif11-like leader